MQIGPDFIDIDDLPRARVGGLRPEPVENLFRRVQWNYAQLEYENQKLKEAAVLEPPAREVPPIEPQAEVAAPPERPVERRAEVAEPVEQAVVPNALVAAPLERAERRPAEPRPRVAPDELARLFLSAAQQAAREARESARRDCELMLKKARERALELDREFERSKRAREAELVERERDFVHSRAARERELAKLEAAMYEIREQIQSALTSLSAVPALAEPSNGFEPSPSHAPEGDFPSEVPHGGNGTTAGAAAWT